MLPKAVEVADAAFIYDNSEDFSRATLQAIVEVESGLAVTSDAKDWLLHHLIVPLQDRELDRENHALQVAELVDADELRGHYHGVITDVSDSYLVLLDSATGSHVIHDRLMLEVSHAGKPIEYIEGQSLKVRYSATAAPEVSIHDSSF